jgi:stringent starvation protein B
MKALVSAFALLTFVAGTMLPIETYAQAAGTGQTAAPETAAPTTPSTSTNKKKKSSKSHHAKKKSKKSSTAQSSSARQKHARDSIG